MWSCYIRFKTQLLSSVNYFVFENFVILLMYVCKCGVVEVWVEDLGKDLDK